MKKQKIQDKFIYEGFGFPIVLRHVSMIEVRGVLTPDIDFNILQKAVLLGLAYQRSTLTGNQVRFIRLWLEKTLSDFGKLFDVTHPAVVKWEKLGNKNAKISPSTEREIRKYILYVILKEAEDFREAFRKVHEIDFQTSPQELEVDAQRDLLAI